MDPTEKGKDPVKTFGPNIPFSLDVVFGKVKSTGKLPVDVPGLTEDFEYSDKIAYEVGYGLETKLKSNEEVSNNTENIKDIEQTENNKKNNADKSRNGNIVEEEFRRFKNRLNPKTGVSGLTGVLTTLIAAVFAFRFSKK